MSKTRITIYNVDKDEFVDIDPSTMCRRCGADVPEGESVMIDGYPFKVCLLHCVGCESISTTPNKLDYWRADDTTMFRGPICEQCHKAQHPWTHLDVLLITGVYKIQDKAEVDQKPEVDY